MAKDIIAIADENEEYLIRFEECLRAKKLLPYRIDIFSKQECLEEYLLKEKPKICILSDYFFDRITRVDGIKYIRLSDERTDADAIYRYQSAVHNAKQISEICGEIVSDDPRAKRESKGAKLIGIYSPVGRVLQTSFSLVLGQMIAKKHSVLYLNFEAYSGFGCMVQKEFPTGLSDLLYYFKNLEDDFMYRMGDMEERINGLQFIPPALSFMDISQITPSDWKRFLEKICECGKYEYIILDLSDCVQGVFEILRECSKIFTMTKNDGIALAKIAQYERLLNEMDFTDVVNKTVKCFVPEFYNVPVVAEQLLYSDLAEYVRKVTKGDF